MTEVERAPESMLEALARLGRLASGWPGGACLIGGVAISARVHPRFTRDLDLLIVVGAEEVGALVELARVTGYDVAHLDRELADAGLLHLPGPAAKAGPAVDLIVADSDWLEDVVRRAIPLDLGPVTLPVATLEDLLLLKLEAHRPQDIDDILAIKDVAGGALDMAYVRGRAAEIGVLDRVRLYLG